MNALKEEVETLNKKLKELTEEELAQVTGGDGPDAAVWEKLKQLAIVFVDDDKE